MPNRWQQCNGRGCNRRMRQFLKPALLLLLQQSPAHGYTLLNRMAEFGLDFLDPAVIYRTLRELETQGQVTSTWDDEETQGPPRRVYTLTLAGQEALRCCVAQLRVTQQILEYFMALHNELAAEGAAEHPAPAATVGDSTRRIAISATGITLEAEVSPVFGRCAAFILADPDTLDFEALPNPAQHAAGGAGVQAAQTILRQGAQAVLALDLGENAFRVIHAAGIPIYRVQGTTVREAIAAFNAGTLTQLEAPKSTPRRHRYGH